MSEKLIKREVYECKYCGRVYESKEMGELHLTECLNNYDDVRTCTTCKFATINLVAPYEDDNGYKSMRLTGADVLGPKAYLTCGKGTYNGKLKEEIILREDKGCYEPMTEEDRFIVNKTDEYLRYKETSALIDKQQAEVDSDIDEYWQEVKDLKEQGKTDDEVVAYMKEKYRDEKAH